MVLFLIVRSDQEINITLCALAVQNQTFNPDPSHAAIGI
jgi:hypothetical protein